MKVKRCVKKIVMKEIKKNCHEGEEEEWSSRI